MLRGKNTGSILTLTSLLCLSGTIVLLFLLLLAGAYEKNPLQRIFLLQADTRGIPNAPDGMCHWTLYNVTILPSSAPAAAVGADAL
jgi:hypothetical protein